MDLGLKGKAVLVAGGSAGIGAAAARAFAAEGARVAITSRTAAAAAEGAETLRALGAEVLTVTADFTRAGDAEAAVQAAVDGFGRLDVLVVSVGAAQGGLFWTLDDSVWEAAIALKLMGTVRLLRAAAPLMRDQGSGSIVVVVGNNGRQPGARLAPGSAVNAACLAVVKALADELAPHGVRVNAVNPGPTRTRRWDTMMTNLAAGSGRSVEAEEAAALAPIPLGRINEADEIGRLVAFVASEMSATMTGTSITADGGLTRALP
jgi:NAD(P)-dependent dehydrogenase (short-subunit alcohol dehydrogenase family)